MEGPDPHISPSLFNQKLEGPASERPLSPDSAALGLGGRMSFDFAVTLARTGVSRDYVLRSLLARGVPKERAQEIVEAACPIAKEIVEKKASSTIFIGLAQIVAGGVLALVVSSGSRGGLWSPFGVALALVGVATLIYGLCTSGHADKMK